MGGSLDALIQTNMNDQLKFLDDILREAEAEHKAKLEAFEQYKKSIQEKTKEEIIGVLRSNVLDHEPILCVIHGIDDTSIKEIRSQAAMNLVENLSADWWKLCGICDPSYWSDKIQPGDEVYEFEFQPENYDLITLLVVVPKQEEGESFTPDPNIVELYNKPVTKEDLGASVWRTKRALYAAEDYLNGVDYKPHWLFPAEQQYTLYSGHLPKSRERDFIINMECALLEADSVISKLRRSKAMFPATLLEHESQVSDLNALIEENRRLLDNVGDTALSEHLKNIEQALQKYQDLIMQR